MGAGFAPAPAHPYAVPRTLLPAGFDALRKLCRRAGPGVRTGRYSEVRGVNESRSFASHRDAP